MRRSSLRGPCGAGRKDAIRKGFAAHPEYQTPEVHEARDTVIEQLASGPGEIRRVIPTDGILIIDNHISLTGSTAFTAICCACVPRGAAAPAR
jgi:hypothetical protein